METPLNHIRINSLTDYELSLLFINTELKNEFCLATSGSEDLSDNPSYQVMPNMDMDTYPDEYDFFEWFCYVYEKKQFFKSPFETVVRYIEHRRAWFNSGKPKWSNKNLNNLI